MNRFCLGFFFALLGFSADDAAAAPSRSTSSTAASSAPAKAKVKSRASSGTPQRRSTGTASRAPRKPSRSQATPAAKPAAPTPAPELLAEPEAPARSDLPPSGASEARVQPAEEKPATAVVKTEAADQDKGVKTYTFGAQEVEGRLRSPQILYFLRRVRAEFDAEPLGHRSFLLELSDTRRHSALW